MDPRTVFLGKGKEKGGKVEEKGEGKGWQGG